MRRLACLCTIAAAALASACSEDETYQTGLVVRPSGLASVEWKYDPAAPDGARSDLFVADPEAGGVSVAQFNTYYPATSSVTLASRIVFVRSPSLFFPLVLPAPAYTTQVATASTAATRMFALSPIDGRLHVFGIGESPYGTSVTESNPYSVQGALALATDLADPQGLVPDDLFTNGLAVDVEVLRDDLIVLAVDDLVSGDARLVSVSVTGSPVVAQVVGSATIASSPRRIAVRSSSPRGVWVSSASTSSVSFVPLVGADRALGAAQLVGVGGPTSAVVDAAGAGALALRLDRASVVYLDAVGSGFVRASRPLFSPYTDGLEGPGELRTRSVPVAGALGRVPALLSPPRTNVSAIELVAAADRESDGRAPVVFVAYSDGGGAFLVGPGLRWPTSAVRPIAFTRGDEAGVRFEGCPSTTPAVCEAVTDDADVTPFECAGARALARGGDVTVTYRGAFAVAPRAAIAPTTSTTPGLVEIATGDGASGFDQARIGDRVFVALPIQAACGTSTAVAGEGVVREAGADRLAVVLDGGALADRVASCGMEVAEGRVEAFSVGPEFVIARGAERERVVATATAGRYFAASDEGIEASFSVADTATCAVASVPIRSCASDADCPGATCTISDSNLCGGRCAACVATTPGCWRAVPERRCPTGALSVSSTAGVLNEVEVGFTPSTNRLSLPEDVVFSRVRQAWIVSFPGARRIGDARVSASGALTLDELK